MLRQAGFDRVSGWQIAEAHTVAASDWSAGIAQHADVVHLDLDEISLGQEGALRHPDALGRAGEDDLRDTGVLTETEFAAEKARTLRQD